MRSPTEVKFALLDCLREAAGPIGGTRLQARLEAAGCPLQPRSIRLHLLRLDREGLTRLVSRRRGRELTARGLEELARTNIVEKVGFVAAKIDALCYRMTFGCQTGSGTLITNVATMPASFLARALEYMKPVFDRRLGMGHLVALAREGGQLGSFKVPLGQVALGTVCSMTVNGILWAERINLTARYGGLLELREGKPLRFVELVEYRGTTLDPLEFFINANMTRVRDCARTGSGLLAASFREFPSVAWEDVQRLIRQLERLGLGGILAVGRPNQPLLNIPVSEGRTGMVVLGGLNPIAALREAGAPVSLKSLFGLEPYASFRPFHTVRDRFPG